MEYLNNDYAFITACATIFAIFGSRASGMIISAVGAVMYAAIAFAAANL
jgi:hypothetical protein